MNYPSKIDIQEKFLKKNSTSSLNVLHIKEQGIDPAYISKINWNCEK